MSRTIRDECFEGLGSKKERFIVGGARLGIGRALIKIPTG